MRILIVSLLLVAFCFQQTNAQTAKVRASLLMVAQGNTEIAQNELKSLLTEFPNDPGVQLLRGVLLDDAMQALEIYQHIVQNHPMSEWADDAYWRIVQYYAIKGDTANARINLEVFRRKYPMSEFLMPATEIVKHSVGLHESQKPGTISPPAETAAMQEHDHFQSVASGEKQNQDEKKVDERKYYGLQVGIFSSREAAETEKNKYVRQRILAEVREKAVNGKLMYAVVVGNYSSLESALAAKNIIGEQCNCTPIVFSK